MREGSLRPRINHLEHKTSTPDNFGAPLAVINRLWEVSQPERLPVDDHENLTEHSNLDFSQALRLILPYILKSLKNLPLNTPIQQGVWDSYRITVPNPSGGEMNVDFFVESAEDTYGLPDGSVQLTLRPYEHNYPEAAQQYFATTILNMHADPKHTERRLAQKQQEIEARELESRKRYEAIDQVCQSLVSLHQPDDEPISLITQDSLVREYLVRSLWLDDPAEADQFTIRLRRLDENATEYKIEVFKDRDGRKMLYDIREFSVRQLER